MEAHSEVFIAACVISNDSSSPHPGLQFPGAQQPCYSRLFNCKKAINCRLRPQILSTDACQATTDQIQLLCNSLLYKDSVTWRLSLTSNCCTNSIGEPTMTEASHTRPAAARQSTHTCRVHFTVVECFIDVALMWWWLLRGKVRWWRLGRVSWSEVVGR